MLSDKNRFVETLEGLVFFVTDTEQPRVPAGSPAGGQFASGSSPGGSGSGLRGGAAAAGDGVATSGTGSHFTSNPDSVARDGFDLDASGAATWQGSGLYLFTGETGATGQGSFSGEKITVDFEMKSAFVGSTSDIEKKVTELKSSLVPPIFKLPDGSTVPDGQGGLIRIWNPEQTQNAALRRAWLKAGYDGVQDTDTGVTIIMDPKTIKSAKMGGRSVKVVEKQKGLHDETAHH